MPEESLPLTLTLHTHTSHSHFTLASHTHPSFSRNIPFPSRVEQNMKTLPIAAAAILLAASVLGFSQSGVSCGQALSAALHSSANLAIDSRPAGLEIVGTDQEAIHVTCTADDMQSAKDIHIRFSGTPDKAKLAVTGPFMKNGNLNIRIEVPRKTNLGVQMSAGQVKVEEVKGNKDIEIHAGQISISSDHKWDYKKIDASVAIGQVNAQVYSTDKGGFFRSFHKENAEGEYQLRAHVTTGQIDLLGKHAGDPTNPQ